MPADALVLTLIAAVIHAAWNAGLAGAPDVRATTAAAAVCGAVLLAPFGLLAWDVEAGAWPYLGGAIVAEVAYLALLAAAYARAEMSVVYPIARGSAPVLVLVVAGASLLQGVGVLVVCAGVLAVRGLQRPESATDLLLALGIGVTIATYTLLDKEGLRHAATVPYLWVELSAAGLAYAAFVGVRRVRSALSVRTAVIGAGTFASYGLVLAALELAPAPAVAAVRETSILFAVALGVLWLGERVSSARAGGAIAVVAGVVLVAVG